MWSSYQREYVVWAKNKLPEDYHQIAVTLLTRFNKWIRLNSCKGLVLDVGCGIDKIGGVSYGEFFGFDDSKRSNWIGIDPLLGRCTVRAVAEYLPFRDKIFQKAIIYTSIDHFFNVNQAFAETVRVGREVNLWFTEFPNQTVDTHPYRVTLEEIQRLRCRVESLREPWPKSNSAFTVFVKVYPPI